jgi:hypothetical protein
MHLFSRSGSTVPIDWYPSSVNAGHTIKGWLVLLFLTRVSLLGQTKACLPDLTTALSYPPSVLQNRIQGPVESTVRLDTAANIVEIQSSGYPGLTARVEAVMRSVQFGSGCADEQISVKVNFEISESLEPNSKILIKRLSESSYQVVAPNQVVITTNSDPAWIFTRRGRMLHRMQRALPKLKFWWQQVHPK